MHHTTILRKKNRFMKSLWIIVSSILLLCVPGILLFGSGSQENISPLKVVTTTSLIEQIVHRIGDEKVDVINIIPPAQCPGHFDVKPKDIQKLADADIFLLHGWQGEKFSNQLISSVENPDLTVERLDIQGNWMVPSVQREAAEKIKEILVNQDAKNSSYYEKQTLRYIELISAKEEEIKAKLKTVDITRIKVLCAEMQVGFVKWTGLSVVAAYGLPDSLTPGVVKELVDKGKSEKVSLIIDNLQSSKDAGKGIAEELNCPRIILSNFPGGVKDTETWEKTIDYNIQLIFGCIKNEM
ncbi:MAG: zinc ABC transporter substrate-binding protein [Spirochaetales bacterium]|nr:zinc ABC transporter substrate-binding protein [Spirochaetales bacterium]